MLGVYLSPTLTVMFRAKGIYYDTYHSCGSDLFFSLRILEYLNRDDADRAVRELDGKELRGRPVRVAFDDSVSISFYFETNSLYLCIACWA